MRALGERAQPGEREGCVTTGVPPRLEVVADEDGVEAERLCEDAVLEQRARVELLRGCLVAELHVPPPTSVSELS